MELEKVRKQYGLSQIAAANIINIPIRTYIRYEKNNNYGNNLKRDMMIKSIIDACEITETKGIPSIDVIKKKVFQLINDKYKNEIDFCYIFGSYAKGYATEKSDIDICVSTKLEGLKFVGLKIELENNLHKNIDLIRFSDLTDNLGLINEIMKDGIKVYG